MADTTTEAVELREAQQFFNCCAVEVIIYGATIDRLQKLESAWVNLQTQFELAELAKERSGVATVSEAESDEKGKTDE